MINESQINPVFLLHCSLPHYRSSSSDRKSGRDQTGFNLQTASLSHSLLPLNINTNWSSLARAFPLLCACVRAYMCAVECGRVPGRPSACHLASSPRSVWAGDAVCTCLMAVRKPCGLKKPVIQKQLGRPSKIQAWNCRFRSSSSVNQNPRVLEAHEAWKKKKRKRTQTKHYNQIHKTVIWTDQKRGGTKGSWITTNGEEKKQREE